MAEETSTPAMALLKGNLFSSLMEGTSANRLDGMSMSGREHKEQIRNMMQERKAEEVKIAEVEGRLRNMILDVLRPTVASTTTLQSRAEHLQEQVTRNTEKLRLNAESIKELTERSDVMISFRDKLQMFTEHSFKTDEKLDEYKRLAVLKMEKLEHAYETQDMFLQKVERNVQRSTEDFGIHVRDFKAVKQTIDFNAVKAKENLDREMKRVNFALNEAKELQNKREREIWGPDDDNNIDDFSHLSLRFLDKQRKTMKGQLHQAIIDIEFLKRLDIRVEGILQKLVDVDSQLASIFAKESDLRNRVQTLVENTENENKRVSNLMAAFTANLMQDVRTSFSQDIKGLYDSQGDIQKFCHDTRLAMGDLESSFGVTAKKLEAAWKEVRLDLESLDTKRKRDKKGLDEAIQFINGRSTAAVDVSDKSLKGLENLSNVLNLVLQGQHAAVALNSQDFNDRLKTPYVGVHGVSDKRRNIATRQGGLDPRALFRISFQPEPAMFQGTSFQRRELLALYEKLVKAAHDVLQQGPAAKQHRRIPDRDNSPDNLENYMPQMISGEELTELPSGRQSVPMVPRSGSRGQPGARGSPLLGDCRQPRLASDSDSPPCFGMSTSTKIGWETAEMHDSPVVSTADGTPAGHPILPLRIKQPPTDARPDTANAPGTRLPTLKGSHTDGRFRSSTPGPAAALQPSKMQMPGSPSALHSARP